MCIDKSNGIDLLLSSHNELTFWNMSVRVLTNTSPDIKERNSNKNPQHMNHHINSPFVIETRTVTFCLYSSAYSSVYTQMHDTYTEYQWLRMCVYDTPYHWSAYILFQCAIQKCEHNWIWESETNKQERKQNRTLLRMTAHTYKRTFQTAQ